MDDSVLSNQQFFQRFLHVLQNKEMLKAIDPPPFWMNTNNLLLIFLLYTQLHHQSQKGKD